MSKTEERENSVQGTDQCTVVSGNQVQDKRWHWRKMQRLALLRDWDFSLRSVGHFKGL